MLSGTFLASNVTQVTVISGWNGSYGSMGPEGHIRSLVLVNRAMPGVSSRLFDDDDNSYYCSDKTKIMIIK